MTDKFTKEAVEQLSKSMNEPEWMLNHRLAAFAVYEKLPMPTTDDEAWRRTDIRRLDLDAIGPDLVPDATGAANIPAHMLSSAFESLSGQLLMIDGVTTQYEFSEVEKAQGVVFCDMQTAVREHSDLLKQYFMTEAVKIEEGKFSALHAAFWLGGTFLYVPKNVKVDAPFHSALWAQGGRTFTHTLVVLDEGAEATLIDEYESPKSKDAALHNGVIELIVRDNANLRYAGLQDFGTNVWQMNHERGRVGRDGKLDWVTSVMGSRLTKAFQTVELDEPGSYARMSGLFFTHGRQHFDLDTQQNHNSHDTVSDLLYKGALSDNSRSVWQGMIKALKDSQRIDGFQANRNLILDTDSRADSIPGLEIEADDVACTHASTIGRLDPEEIFYLMSRGIEREIAIEMVVQGFFDPVMQRIPNDLVRDRIEQRILDKVR